MVEWMRNVGDPWMKVDKAPAPGSELAEDDKTKPTVSSVASYGIVTALDHLGSVVDAMMNSFEHSVPIRHYAHFTALRTTLMVSARVRWLLEPDEREERKRRCVRIRFQNLDEQQKAVNELEGTHLDDDDQDGRQKALDAMEAEKVALDAQAKALGAAGLSNPLDTVSMLRSQVDPNCWYGVGIRQLWRSGSAAAHGYSWRDMHRDQPGVFDEESFNMALYGGFLHLQEALKLYDQRAAAPS